MVRAIIIEDSPEHREKLRNLLLEYTDIELLGQFKNAEEGLKGIQNLSPNLVFLDVEMPPGKDGIEMLSEIPSAQRNFGVIFTTSHSKYAIQAINMACLDYLEKPIDAEKLAAAIEKHRVLADQEFRAGQFNILQQFSSQRINKNQRLAIPGITKGSRLDTIINVSDIIYCKTGQARTAKDN